VVLVASCSTTPPGVRVSGDAVVEFALLTRKSQTAIVSTTFEVTGIPSGDISVSSEGPVNIKSGDARLAFDDHGQKYAADVSDSVMFIEGDLGVPIREHNQVAAAVAGAPMAPLELIESLWAAKWSKEGNVYRVAVPRHVAKNVLRTDLGTVQTNRFVSRLEDPKFFERAAIELIVTPDTDGRVKSTDLRFKTDGVSIRTQTSFSKFEIPFTPPSGGERAPRLDFEQGGYSRSDSEVAKLIATSKRPVVVMYGARWCPVCHDLKPSLSQSASLHSDQFEFAVVDIDEYPKAGINISAIPETYVYVDGSPVDHFLGSMPFEDVEEWLARVA
jgi:thioredoxin 1